MSNSPRFEGTRSPAVAGLFYPRNPAVLGETVHSLLAEARVSIAETAETSITEAIKVLIVPHAGYAYSGPVAASAYARLSSQRDLIRRVILLGPAHRFGFQGLAVASAAQFASPLGAIDVDQTAVRQALTLPAVRIIDEAHELEHSLEVQLPFLQSVLSQFEVVPLVVGEATSTEVADVLRLLWGGSETCLVISSDLSHYHEDHAARALDGQTCEFIQTGRDDLLSSQNACGYLAVQGAIQCAREHNLRFRNVDLRNSSQTAGTPERVVGYGAFIAEPTGGAVGTQIDLEQFNSSSTDRLTRSDKRMLLRVAAAAIRRELKTGSPPAIDPLRFSMRLQVPQATFVTLKAFSELRGCMGSIEASEPLVVSVGRSAGNAAFRDERFPKLTEAELPGLEVHLSVLSSPVSMNISSEQELVSALHPETDGLILREGTIYSVFLPSVWNQISEPAEFVKRLKEKAGWEANHWSDSMSAERFTVTAAVGRMVDSESPA